MEKSGGSGSFVEVKIKEGKQLNPLPVVLSRSGRRSKVRVEEVEVGDPGVRFAKESDEDKGVDTSPLLFVSTKPGTGLYQPLDRCTRRQTPWCERCAPYLSRDTTLGSPSQSLHGDTPQPTVTRSGRGSGPSNLTRGDGTSNLPAPLLGPGRRSVLYRLTLVSDGLVPKGSRS